LKAPTTRFSGSALLLLNSFGLAFHICRKVPVQPGNQIVALSLRIRLLFKAHQHNAGPSFHAFDNPFNVYSIILVCRFTLLYEFLITKRGGSSPHLVFV